MDKIILAQNTGVYIGGLKMVIFDEISVKGTLNRYDEQIHGTTNKLFNFAEISKKTIFKINDFSFVTQGLSTNRIICRSGAIHFLNTNSSLFKKVIKKYAIKIKQTSEMKNIKGSAYLKAIIK